MDLVKTSRLPRVLAIVPAAIPPAMIYVIKPLQSLAQKNLFLMEGIEEYRATEKKIAWSDVVVLCRNCEPAYKFISEVTMRLNKPLIYDLDDNFWDIPLESEDGQYLRDPNRIQMLETYLKQAAVVRVYNPIVFRKASQFNPHVYQLRPCVDLSLFPQKRIAHQNNHIRLVYPTTRKNPDSLLMLIQQAVIQKTLIYWGKASE